MTNHPTTELLSDESLKEIESQPSRLIHGLEGILLSPAERDALCATVRAAWRDRDRALTPSIVESLRLLDDAGYGKEVPNSMSEMIKKALTENTALLAQLTEAQAHIKAQDARIINQRDEIKERVRLQADAERTVQAYRDALEVEPHRIDGLRRIKEMKSQLTQLTRERDDYRDQLVEAKAETVEAQTSVESLSRVIFYGEQATWMREHCAEKVKAVARSHRLLAEQLKGNAIGQMQLIRAEECDILATSLESLTLEGTKEQ